MIRLLIGDALTRLRDLPDKSVQCCVTSPPYFGLRCYGHPGQIGREPTPEEFVGALVNVFREVRRVLRDDGTFWLNIGDSYASGNRATYRSGASQNKGQHVQNNLPRPRDPEGIKPKDLLGIPWMLAFALRTDGWYLRQEIIWAKPNPMPESVRDRCTKSHEQIFLFSKSPKYYYDADAIAEDATCGRFRGSGPMVNAGTGRNDAGTGTVGDYRKRPSKKRGDFNGKTNAMPGRESFRAVTDKRNKRSVWVVTPKPFKGAHFATFPPDLVEPCILAGTPLGGVVLDPFGGAGTTGLVALEHGRSAILVEINPEYAVLTQNRIGANRVNLEYDL